MNMKTIKRCLAPLAGAMLLSTSAVALPLNSTTVTSSLKVKYSAAEAATPAGAAALYQKLQAAAEKVCRDVGGSMSGVAYLSLAERESLASCISGSLGEAVEAIGIPMVSLLHLQEKRVARMDSLALR